MCHGWMFDPDGAQAASDSTRHSASFGTGRSVNARTARRLPTPSSTPMIATSPSVQHGYVRYAHDGIIQYHIVQCHSAADGYSLGYGLRLMHEANCRSIAMPIRVATQRALRKHVSTDRHKRRKGDILDFHFFSRASSAVLGLRSNQAEREIKTK